MPLARNLPWLAFGVALALSLSPKTASAGEDWLFGTSDREISERAHQIELTLERGYATMVVQRTAHNASDRADEAQWSLELPDTAVATGLRVHGERDGAPHWWVGELLEAPDAVQIYEELTAVDTDHPGARGRDPALLSWDEYGGLDLRVFPVPGEGEATVEYTLEMASEWVDGRWELALPAMGVEEDGPSAQLHIRAPARAPASTARAVQRSDRVFVDGLEVGWGHALVLDTPHTIALIPSDAPAVELELAALDVGEDTLVHWRVSVSAEISEVPRRVHAVVALDLSRSLGLAEVEAQREAALAYLEHLRAPGLDASVAVVGFDHRIRPLTRGFVDADRAVARLRADPLERGNGSDVALALDEARRLFADTRAPRRVVLLTDFLTASSVDLAAYERAAAQTGAVVHLARVTDGAPHLTRDDAHAWATVAAKTQGVVWQASVPADASGGEQARAVFEAWARPTTIDALRYEFGVASRSAAALGEGEGSEELTLSMAGMPDTLTAHGLMWNTPVTYATARDDTLATRWAGLIFATDLYEQLDYDQRLDLARVGGAVTALTSYLAVEPGASPSPDGMWRGRDCCFFLGYGLIGRGGGGGGGIDWSYGSYLAVPFDGRLDRQAWLERRLGDAWARCGGGRDHEAIVVLEATYDEVVDVALYRAAGVGSNAPARASCLREAAWGLTLSGGDFIDERSRWSVSVGA